MAQCCYDAEAKARKHSFARTVKMLVVLADRESKEVLLEYACDPEAFDACAVEAIKDVVSEHGKPRTIYVSRDYSADSLCDLAHWANIRLAQVASVPRATDGLRCEGAV